MEEPSRIENWVRLEQLGSGGFGVVAFWKNEVTKECIAIKKCRFSEKHLTPKQKQRWLKEIELIKSTSHDNIVGFKNLPTLLEVEFERYNSSNLPHLPMEFCNGGNLRRILNLPGNSCGLQEKSVRTVISNVTSALQYLHRQGIAHRDIKPENIVLHFTNSKKVIYKLIDLGYAKEFNDSTISFVGTIMYLAPEIFYQRNYDLRADNWSLGILMFEMITGVFPFYPKNNPYEMFQNITQKKSGDICGLLIPETKTIQYFDSITCDNYLSACFKNLIEGWLRKALEFDPELRGDTNNNAKVFTGLQELLAKVIVTVFSVFTFELYSYEIDTSTLMSTLKNWILRDLRVSADKVLILSTKNCCVESDCSLVTNVIMQTNDIMFYIFESNLIRFPEKLTLHYTIKNMLQEPMNIHINKQTLAKVLFFVSSIHKLKIAVRVAIYVYVKYMEKLYIKVIHEMNSLLFITYKLINQIDFYNRHFSKGVCWSDSSLRLPFNNYVILLQEMKTCLGDLENIQKKQIKIKSQVFLLENHYKDVFVPFEENDLSYLYKKVLKHFSNDFSGVQIRDIISNAIKMAWNIFDDRKLIDFIKQLPEVVRSCSSGQTEVQMVKNSFESSLSRFSQIITNKNRFFENLHYKNGFKQDCDVNSYDYCETDKLIRENINLRSRLLDLISSGIAIESINCKNNL